MARWSSAEKEVRPAQHNLQERAGERGVASLTVRTSATCHTARRLSTTCVNTDCAGSIQISPPLNQLKHSDTTPYPKRHKDGPAEHAALILKFHHLIQRAPPFTRAVSELSLDHCKQDRDPALVERVLFEDQSVMLHATLPCDSHMHGRDGARA